MIFMGVTTVVIFVGSCMKFQGRAQFATIGASCLSSCDCGDIYSPCSNTTKI